MIVASGHHRDLMDALNDRAITRLGLPDLPISAPDYRPKEAEAALDRIRSCFVYGPTGSVAGADLVIAGTDRRTEHNVNQVLKTISERPDLQERLSGTTLAKEADAAYPRWLQSREADVDPATRAKIRLHRETLRVDGTVTESYRRIDIGEALQRLAFLGSDPSREQG